MKIILRILLISVIALVLGGKVFCQQDPVYSQYVFDKMLINPAVVGSSNWIVLSMKHRNQFLGIEGAPLTSILTAHTPIQSKNMGLGLKIVQDNIGVSQVFSFTGFYSYHIGFGNGKLSFGLEGGLIHYLSNYHLLNRIDYDDLAIPATGEAGYVPDVSVGLFYQSRKYYLGASSHHLFNLKNSRPLYEKNSLVKSEVEFNAMAGYIVLASDNFELEPGCMVRYVRNLPVQADAYLNMTFLERMTLGVGYRSGDAVSVICRIIVAKKIRFAYSYDYRLSPLANYSKGSHEVTISYGIELLPPPTRRVVHPRYYF